MLLCEHSKHLKLFFQECTDHFFVWFDLRKDVTPRGMFIRKHAFTPKKDQLVTTALGDYRVPGSEEGQSLIPEQRTDFLGGASFSLKPVFFRELNGRLVRREVLARLEVYIPIGNTPYSHESDLGLSILLRIS